MKYMYMYKVLAELDKGKVFSFIYLFFFLLYLLLVCHVP